jgi:hypothetical protein
MQAFVSRRYTCSESISALESTLRGPPQPLAGPPTDYFIEEALRPARRDVAPHEIG